MTTAAPRVSPLPAELTAQILELYEQGLSLQAYQLGRAVAPLALWQPVEAQVLAGRLANQLGAPRLGRWLFRCAYRSAPQDPEAIYYHAYNVLQSRGSYTALRWIDRHAQFFGTQSADLLS